MEPLAGLPPCLQLVLSWGPQAFVVTRALEAMRSVVWSRVDLTVTPPSPHAITGLQETSLYTTVAPGLVFLLNHGGMNVETRMVKEPQVHTLTLQKQKQETQPPPRPGLRAPAAMR